MLKNSSTLDFTKLLCYFGLTWGLGNQLLPDLFLLKPAIYSHVLTILRLQESRRVNNSANREGRIQFEFPVVTRGAKRQLKFTFI